MYLYQASYHLLVSATFITYGYHLTLLRLLLTGTPFSYFYQVLLPAPISYSYQLLVAGSRYSSLLYQLLL